MIKGRQARLDTYKCKLLPTTMSGGRKYDIRGSSEECQKDMDPFLRDETAILGSGSYGRLFGKMQVFSRPMNNLVSNRGTHTGMVASVSLQIAQRFGLNINLCRAIAFGHDIGHCPYGPNGARILGLKQSYGHSHIGVVILQEVEELNLAKEVVLGILYHSLEKNNLDNGKKLSNEAYTVALSDKIAFLPYDIEDFRRMGMLKKITLPEELKIFGFGNGKDFPKEMRRICINALIVESSQEGVISFSKSEIAIAFQKIREWAYTNIYNKLDYMPEREYHKVNLDLVLEYFIKNGLAENLAPEFAISMMTDWDVDFLAGILKKGNPTSAEKDLINQLSIFEIIKSLNGKKIDHTKSPLW